MSNFDAMICGIIKNHEKNDLGIIFLQKVLDNFQDFMEKIFQNPPKSFGKKTLKIVPFFSAFFSALTIYRKK